MINGFINLNTAGDFLAAAVYLVIDDFIDVSYYGVPFIPTCCCCFWKVLEIKLNFLKKINRLKILHHLKYQSSEILLRKRHLAY